MIKLQYSQFLVYFITMLVHIQTIFIGLNPGCFCRRLFTFSISLTNEVARMPRSKPPAVF